MSAKAAYCRSSTVGIGLMCLGLASVGLAQAPIQAAPAFNAERLSALPRDEWITNGGALSNQRYSPLTRINRDNVQNLRAEWRTGMGSGASPGNSGQAQILVFAGVLYVINGDNDVFAIHVESGETLWRYSANPDPRAGNPFGRSNRGVALGEGRVYAGFLDATVAAIDQQTGEELWRVAVAPWQEGYSITAAPLYYDGLVISGVSGGVMGRRGRVTAFNADDGSIEWVFYTVPGPGEFGHDTWPPDSNAWEHGGAPVWQTPAVDPDLGMIYFSTGNPGPVMNGSVRPGDNLFNNSIVALDVRTGEYLWHFQQVHHDIWDYDAPNPIVLFEAAYEGRRRRGLVQVGKTGWAYILDRVTGEPLIGIEERPVPQEPRQATSPTQPYPVGDSIVPQEIDVVPFDATSLGPDGSIPNNGRIFTPAGGLVFTGHSDGRIMALDKRNGATLWEFMTDAGVNSTVSTFEHAGEQYVVVHAGGGVFANGARGDGIWLFSLNGTIGPVTPGAGGPFGAGPGGAAASEPTRPASIEAGAAIYAEACLPCHGSRGDGGEGGGASLLNELSIESAVAISVMGRNNMPAFGDAYSVDELYDVATYIVERLAGP